MPQNYRIFFGFDHTWWFGIKHIYLRVRTVATCPYVYLEFDPIFWGWRGQMQSVSTFDWNFKYLESNFHSFDSNFILLEPIFSSLDCNFICLAPLAEALEVNFSSLECNFICLEVNFSSVECNFMSLEVNFSSIDCNFSSFDDRFTFQGFINPKCAECFYFLDFPRTLISIQLVTAKNHNNQSLTLDLKNVNKTMLAYYFGTRLD